MEVGDRLEVDILSIAHGGHFVARHEGRVIFVRHAISGERVEIEITDMSATFARADAIRIIHRSEHRATPPCSLAHPGGCGGCDFQHIALSHQRELKAAIIKEQFARIGKLDIDVNVEEVLPTSHWRTRMDFTVSSNRKLALYGARSHDLIEIDSCHIADAAIDIAGINNKKLPIASKIHVAVASDQSVTVDIEGRESRTLIEQEVLGRAYSLTPTSFWQSHKSAPEHLSKSVRELALAKFGDHVFDLYGGVGLFTGVLITEVGKTGRVTLIESDGKAITDARRNFATEPNVEIVEGKVEREIKRFVRADVVIADPPRAGLGAAVCAAIVALKPRTVVYVSCDPASLARDARILIDAGYRMDHIRAFDLFPMTQHIECVARFIY